VLKAILFIVLALFIATGLPCCPFYLIFGPRFVGGFESGIFWIQRGKVVWWVGSLFNGLVIGIACRIRFPQLVLGCCRRLAWLRWQGLEQVEWHAGA
jgi:hypothetical protein